MIKILAKLYESATSHSNCKNVKKLYIFLAVRKFRNDALEKVSVRNFRISVKSAII